MIAHEATTGQFVEWRGERLPNGMLLNPNDAERMPDAELEALSLFKVSGPDPIPAGKVSTQVRIQRVNGVVKYVHTLQDAPVVDWDAQDQAELNSALAAEGSVFRALALLVLQEINVLRKKAALPEYTQSQLVTALKAKMR